MYRLYEKNELTFALVWIGLYCLITIPIRGQFGDGSLYMVLGLVLIALSLGLFIKNHHLEEKYGLDHWPKNTRRFLYFIPAWILATGNLWGGISLKDPGLELVFALISMVLIGYIEEVIFRGFLFKAMVPRDGIKKSILIASLTFGLGHIVNLLAGQTDLETILQVFFAIAWGFILTSIFYKSKSLLPGILIHGLVDACSKFSRENPRMEWIYMLTTILVALVYCGYLLRQPSQKKGHLAKS